MDYARQKGIHISYIAGREVKPCKSEGSKLCKLEGRVEVSCVN